MVGYHQTNQKTDTGKTLTRWPVLVDHNSTEVSDEQYERFLGHSTSKQAEQILR
ncbi:insulinase family protein, partial [Citrobacter freundii]|nr:insulinase family protein [Citrobacter freundii]